MISGRLQQMHVIKEVMLGSIQCNETAIAFAEGLGPIWGSNDIHTLWHHVCSAGPCIHFLKRL